MRLPIIIHSRDAAKDTYDIMKSLHAEDIGGVVHCFSYSKEMARQFLDMGFYIGIGGVVTFKNAKTLKEVAAYTPLDRIVLETDCPYLSPEPNRGKRNSSLNLNYVVRSAFYIISNYVFVSMGLSFHTQWISILFLLSMVWSTIDYGKSINEIIEKKVIAEILCICCIALSIAMAYFVGYIQGAFVSL